MSDEMSASRLPAGRRRLTYVGHEEWAEPALVAKLRDALVITVEGPYSDIMRGRLRDHAAGTSALISTK